MEYEHCILVISTQQQQDNFQSFPVKTLKIIFLHPTYISYIHIINVKVFVCFNFWLVDLLKTAEWICMIFGIEVAHILDLHICFVSFRKK